jgi:hypothetical protein
VLQRDKLEHLRVVAVRLQQQRAQPVGDHLGLLAQVDAMLQHRLEQLWQLHLRTDLLVAARRAHDDGCARADAGVQRVIGGGVAGVQRNHDVEALRHEAADVAGLEAQAVEPAFGDGVVAQLDEIRPQLDADDVECTRCAAGLAAQVVVQREREVALAGTEVDDVERRRRADAGRLERVRHHLDELVDLLPLARHRGHEFVARRGDAQFREEGRVQAQEAVLLAVVLRAVLVAGGDDGGTRGVLRRTARDRARAVQRVAALAAHHQLQLGVLREQVRVREARANQRRDGVDCVRHRLVLRDVLRPMLEDERQAALAAQHQRPRGHALQVVALGCRLAEQHARDAAIRDPLRQRLEEALALGEIRQRTAAGVERRRVGDGIKGFRRHGAHRVAAASGK